MKYEFDNPDKFDSIEVTLTMGCKLDCRFCPQKLLLNRYFSEDRSRTSMMSFDDFKKIADKVKKGGTICFSGMCEAFLNPACTDMIVYAYEEGFRLCLLTTLVGMKKEDIERLKTVEFDDITLHIPDQEGNSKFEISDDYIEILRLFQDNIRISSYSCHGEIHPAVEKYIDKSIICVSAMMNRAGNLDCGAESHPKGEVVCMVGTNGKYGNWTPEILPDGTVLLCCMDYGMKHVLGNILKTSVREILDGIEYKRVQKGMKDESADILCRKCNGAIEIGRTPAYRFKKAKEKYKSTKQAEIRNQEILKQFTESKNICVFGLGKWFWNNFFHQKWNDVLDVACYCDNNTELWGKEIDGIRCISPKELYGLEELTVVMHIKDDTLVRQQLLSEGIKNIVNIQELYDYF